MLHRKFIFTRLHGFLITITCILTSLTGDDYGWCALQSFYFFFYLEQLRFLSDHPSCMNHWLHRFYIYHHVTIWRGRSDVRSIARWLNWRHIYRTDFVSTVCILACCFNYTHLVFLMTVLDNSTLCVNLEYCSLHKQSHWSHIYSYVIFFLQ